MALTSTTSIRKGNLDLSGEEIVAVIDELQTKVTALATLANELKADHNAHVHVENAGATYTQNASTATAAAQVASPDVTI